MTDEETEKFIADALKPLVVELRRVDGDMKREVVFFDTVGKPLFAHKLPRDVKTWVELSSWILATKRIAQQEYGIALDDPTWTPPPPTQS